MEIRFESGDVINQDLADGATCLPFNFNAIIPCDVISVGITLY